MNKHCPYCKEKPVQVNKYGNILPHDTEKCNKEYKEWMKKYEDAYVLQEIRGGRFEEK